MTMYKSNGDRVPDHIHAMAESARAGKVDRREFLALATAFGASTAMAYGMLGLAAPTKALAQETPTKGGVIKVAMSVKDPKDPRTADWSEIANAERQTLEPLVKYTRDFTFVEDIAEGVIRASDDAAQPNPDWDSDRPDPATSGVAPWRVYNIGNAEPVNPRYSMIVSFRSGMFTSAKASLTLVPVFGMFTKLMVLYRLAIVKVSYSLNPLNLSQPSLTAWTLVMFGR